MPKNLTKAQARQVQEIIDRARRDDGIPRTAQQSIPFQRMFPEKVFISSLQMQQDHPVSGHQLSAGTAGGQNRDL